MATPNVSERVYTAEEFFRLPDPIEGGKMELVCGRVVTHMPVSGKHGRTAIEVATALNNFAKRGRIGTVVAETGFLVRRNPDTVRAPDVAYFSNEALGEHGFPDEGFVPFAPTLAVEVIPSDALDDVVSAATWDYRQAGIARTWVVRPALRTVTVHFPDGVARMLSEGATLTSDDAGFTVPGFELPVTAIFE